MDKIRSDGFFSNGLINSHLDQIALPSTSVDGIVLRKRK